MKKRLTVTADPERLKYIVNCTDGVGARVMNYERVMEFMQRANSLGFIFAVNALIPVQVSFNIECDVMAMDADEVMEVE